MKNRKENESKKSWDQETKGRTVLGVNPVHWYI